MKRRWGKRTAGQSGRCRGRAAAIVEFAVVLPLLLTILFGIIEYGWVFMVRQTLQHGAREGCRIASLQTSVAPYQAALDRITQVMQPTNLTDYQVQITPGVCEETVTITVPYDSVSLMSGFFGSRSTNLTGQTTMRKEGCVPP